MLDPPPVKQGSTREGGYSLVWALFSSVVLVTVMVFMVVQLFDPSKAAVAYAERVDFAHLAAEVSDNLPWILILVSMMMAGVFAALHLGLRPLRRISERAGEIGPATVSQRLPLESTPREIAPLVVAFNAALDRLEAGLRAQRDFSANAAHELRTPLATLRAQVESVLEPSERQDAIEEFDRLSRLIAQLLTLAEADGGDAPVMVSFDLVETAREVARDMAGALVAGGRTVGFDSVPDHWECRGAPGLVEVALRNLLENAARHTPLGSEILVAIDVFGRLTVSDTGPGIPTDFRTRLFQRFSKADPRGAGAGLGLSIVSRIMALHGGEARLDPSPAGARFVLDFSQRGYGGRNARP
uniref:ATP-binding protein n=1 Tax=uncultured Caulobacter sp. TaxID=158749 RepID=UPI0025FF59AE|nr:ATP-binding protein [uncultured Caulobacter sp.]